MAYEVPDGETLLFDFNKASKKNKVKLRVNDGNWSKPFSIDVAGTTNSVDCKGSDKPYTVLDFS